MIFYVSNFSKKLVNRNNGVSTKALKIFNHTVDTLEIQIVDCNNQLLDIPSGQFYFTGSYVKKNDATPIFLSTNYAIDGKTLTFTYSTYTYEFLNLIKGENVAITVEIGYKDAEGQHMILQDIAYANQRYYIEGMPDPAHLSEYYTKTETDSRIDEKISQLDFATEEYVDTEVATRQEKITAENKLDYALLSGTPTIPTKTSDLENDSGFITNDALSGKQDLITAENKLAYSLISGTPTIPQKVSDLENDSGFITASALEGYATEEYVTASVSGKADTSALTAHTSDTTIHVTAEDKTTWNGKQDAITNDNKLAYSLLSGTPSIPQKTSDLQNDSDYATSGYVNQETSGKLDAPSGGTAGQVLTKTADGTEWADLQGPNTIEVKELGQDTAYKVDFNGKLIQKYGTTSAASGTVEIDFEGMENIPSGTAPTIELQIPASGEVSVITLPSAVQVIAMPDTLEGGEEGRNYVKYAYHDIVFRAEEDANGDMKTYANYAYKFDETKDVPDTRDYFWIEARADNSYLACNNYNAAYNLSASVGDKNSWVPITSWYIALANTGTTAYVVGNTTTLGATASAVGLCFDSNLPFACGGKVFSLYSDLLKPKTLTNDNDLFHFFNSNTKIIECGVDFGPVKNMAQAFYGCTSLSALLDGFSCVNATKTSQMLQNCSKLSALPDGFSCPNTTTTDQMFRGCTNLSVLPDGFRCPNATSTVNMFRECSNLSALPDGFNCPNTTNIQRYVP